ncbi:MAG: hypothetical protein ACE5G6_00110 [Terriglobia bacterium]
MLTTERRTLWFAVLVLVALALPGSAQESQSDNSASSETQKTAQPPEDEFLTLGVRHDYQARERYNTIEQINTVIPPLYQPAFVGHGYVLPPGAMRIGARLSVINVGSDDFFKNGRVDPVHENHEADRVRVDVDFFYGLDHNMTVFVNFPYLISRSIGSVHPAGVQTLDLFVEGNTQAVGDASVIFKKKWWDQANFYFNFATVTGLKLPTGSDDATFDDPMVVQMPDGSLAPAFGGGPFPRFTDDGALPQVLQPGTGGMGYILGFMGTRQFLRPRGALHGGVVFRFLTGNKHADPGDEVRFFASYVKPVFRENVSLDLTFNGMRKGRDRYDGTFTHPVPNPDGTLKGIATTPRPPFQGGTVAFFSPSLIWSVDPQIRVTATASFRLNQPDLGPWPGTIFQLGVTYTFALFPRPF